MKLTRGVLLFFFLTVAPSVLFAQNYTIRGTVSDAETREALAGAAIFIEKGNKGAISDAKGNFSITLPEGEYLLITQFFGYEPQSAEIRLVRDVKRDIRLTPLVIGLEDVIVSSTRPDANVTSALSGIERLDIKAVNKLPVLFGERDIIKSLQLTPGVKSAGEGSSGFFVRGGSADQNLILLDGVTVYNASHLMGFFSTFNSDVLGNASLYRGAMPAQYGERLSSILDVQQRNGDIEHYHVSGGIGIISSKINVEGPVQKGRSSFLFGARRTYADAIARLAGVKEAQDASLYFYDLNGRINFALSPRDDISISAYHGMDKMGVDNLITSKWANTIASIRWSHKMRGDWESSAAFAYNRYNYYYGLLATDIMAMNFTGRSIINDYSLRQEFIYTPSNRSRWHFGAKSIFHDVLSNNYDIDPQPEYLHRYSSENAIYASNQLTVTDNLEIVYGLRLSAFFAVGPGDYYILNPDESIKDRLYYGSGDLVQSYFSLEPRLSAVYKFNDRSSIKAAYARTTQNMHLLTYANQGTPFDRWITSSNNIKPETADQVSLGYFRNFADNTFELSVEAYYKALGNQIDYRDNAYINTNAIETELLFGEGRAYGIELLFKKRVGKFTGWVGYTLSKSELKIDGIDNGQWYNAYQDRTHDISVVAMYDLNNKWSFSATWVYYTGNAVSYPNGKYEIDGTTVLYYTERNGYRAPAYHRLDLAATWYMKKKGRFESELSFGLYNAYGRENPYMVVFRTDEETGKSSAIQYSLFRFVPSVSWNFKF